MQYQPSIESLNFVSDKMGRENWLYFIKILRSLCMEKKMSGEEVYSVMMKLALSLLETIMEHTETDSIESYYRTERNEKIRLRMVKLGW